MVTLHSDVRRPDAGDDTFNLLAGNGPAADALNRLGLGRVMTSAIRTRLSDGRGGYNPDEPRDWHGRWTTAGGERISPAVGYRRATPIPTGPIGVRRGLLDKETFGPSASGRLYGGRLIRIGDGPGIGDNEPPPEPEEILGPEPSINAPQVPQGWDIPGQVIGGLFYRRPAVLYYKTGRLGRSPRTTPSRRSWPRSGARTLALTSTFPTMALDRRF